MSNLNDLKPIINLNPFARFCCTIGNLPTSYMKSMDYEEQLMWLCDYLENTVIPSVNNNGECVKELQELYVKLKNYVDNYFNNLDVQNEINNKLDEMAEDGTLAQIIEDYATIPELTEKVTKNENDITELNNNLNNLNTDLSNFKENINSKELTEMIVIGDSYSSRTYLTHPNKLWCEIVSEFLNLNLHNYSDPRAGFLADGDERQSTFFTQLNEANNDITFNNQNVKYVFIYGGVNDLIYYDNNIKSLYTNAYNSTLQKAREYFPLAKIIYLGCNTFQNFKYKSMSDGEGITELWIDHNVKTCENAYKNCISFIDLTFFMIGMSKYFENGTYNHPNSLAHIELAQAVINALTSSGNAFTHLISDTPTLNATSWTVDKTLTNRNIFQFRVSDKSVKMDLATSLANPQHLSYIEINYPFGMRIPYSSLDNNFYIPSDITGQAITFNETHTKNQIATQQNVVIESKPGTNQFIMYSSFNTNYDFYDLYYSRSFDL